MTPGSAGAAKNHSGFMVYGATGFTGKLIIEAAIEAGLKPIAAARNADRLDALARRYGIEQRRVELSQREKMDRALSDIDVVLNAAGPFSSTAEAMSESCLRTGTHYIDVTGEIAVFEMLYRKNQQARDRNIMMMPGVGYAVVPSDCLAAHVVNQYPDTHLIRIGISRSTLVSRGSAKTMIELTADKVLVRRSARLENVPAGSLTHSFDFGDGQCQALAVSWPDVFTAFHSTGVQNIETYFEAGPMEYAVANASLYSGWMMKLPISQWLMKTQSELLPEGPSEQLRRRHSRTIVLEAQSRDGTVRQFRLKTPESYSFTALSALAIIENILAGKLKPGFQTPGQVYPLELVTQLAGVRLQQIA